MILLTSKKKDYNLVYVLEANRNYIFDQNNFLKNSYLYDLSNNILLKNINKEPNNITDFIESSYQNSFANIAKGCIYIKKVKNNETNEYIYDVYNTEIYTGDFGNVYANTMLLVSAFLKNEYNIDASILTKIKYKYISQKEISYYEIFKDILSMVIMSLFVGFGFLLFLTGLTYEKINERKNNIKRFIYINGGNIFSYWISYFIIDFIKIMMFSCLLMISTSSVNNSGGYFMLNMLFISLSSLFFIYFVSYFCSKEDSVIKFALICILINLSIIFIFQYFSIEGNIADLILNKFEFTSFDLNPITSMVFSFIRLGYHYCAEPSLELEHGLRPITLALYNSFTVQIFNLVFYGGLFLLTECGITRRVFHYLKNLIILKEKKYIQTSLSSDFDLDNSIGPLTSNSENDSNSNLDEKKAATGISMGVINEVMEEEEEIILGNKTKDNLDIKKINNISRIKTYSYIDPLSNKYVLNESNRIKNQAGFLTIIKGLKKTFWFCCKKKILAVNNLYLGLGLNEKLGLLGYNGSGKTVTFKMIINEILYDTGNISLFGYDNRKRFNKINSIIGYCPQENHIFEYMTVREIIKFFSELKTNDEIIRIIGQKFSLYKYLDILYCNLSGGNKRKLAFALALMNKPDLLLLDEPSTGMDQFSKKMILNNINNLIKIKQRYNMILSTHSVKEADLICDRISWFKNGNFTFIGDINEMKAQKNNLYKLYIKFDQSSFDIEQTPCPEKVEESFKSISELVGSFSKYSDYFISNIELEPQLSELYFIINKIKENATNLQVINIGKDNSYEFYLESEFREKLFCSIIEIKKDFSKISEISIGKDSLRIF